MVVPHLPPGTRLYSYLRFSTPEQQWGDSERRQWDLARQWAERNGVSIYESYADRGLSGHKGHHRKKGAMGRFLKLAADGKIPSGSVLLVENIDRLGREAPSKALREIIFMLWDHGIILVTLSPEETYQQGCDGEPKFVVLLLYLQRAYDESKRKSELVRSARKQARHKAQTEKKRLTKRCPAWLVPDGNGFAVLPSAADTILQIFQWRLEGLGATAITKQLNEGSYWRPEVSEHWAARKRKGGLQDEGWRESYVKKILRNPAVTGVYQPHEHLNEKRLPTGDPIPDYYPAIVEPAVFADVQQRMETASRNALGDGRSMPKGGRTGKVNNLFTGLLVCPYCRGSMTYFSGAYSERPKGREYLVCDRGRRKVKVDGQLLCPYHSIRYKEVEQLLLENCPHLQPEMVLPEPGERKKEQKRLLQIVNGKRGQLLDIERKVSNLMGSMEDEDDPKIRNQLRSRLATLNAQHDKLEEELKAAESELATASKDATSLAEWQQSLESMKGMLGDISIRFRLRQHLKELISKVELFTHGHPYVYDPQREVPEGEEGDTIAEGEDEPGFTDHPAYPAFIEKLLERRMSKEGRFLRVHFSTGGIVDLVPPGSLASGFRWDGGAWKQVRPDIEGMWAAWPK